MVLHKIPNRISTENEISDRSIIRLNETIAETRKLIFLDKTEITRAISNEAKRNPMFQEIILEEKSVFTVDYNPKSVIDLQAMGFSQNQLRSLDSYFKQKANIKLFQSREKQFKEADNLVLNSMSESDYIECGVSIVSIRGSAVKSKVTWRRLQSSKLKDTVRNFIKMNEG